MHKSEISIKIQDGKGKIIYERKGRMSKELKLLIKHAIEKKWVLKNDIFGIVKHTMQFSNIWEYFEALKKSEKEANEDEA